jgi:hypothetical protein
MRTQPDATEAFHPTDQNIQHAEVEMNTFLRAHRALAANPATEETGKSKTETRAAERSTDLMLHDGVERF